MLRIKYKECVCENAIYLYAHENKLAEKILENSSKEMLLVSDFSLILKDVNTVYTRVDDKIISYLRFHPGKYSDLDFCDLYIDYSLEDAEKESADDEENIEFIHASEMTSEEFLNIFDSYSSERAEEDEAFLDMIDHFMAKGRDSKRAEERGEKYLKSF